MDQNTISLSMLREAGGQHSEFKKRLEQSAQILLGLISSSLGEEDWKNLPCNCQFSSGELIQFETPRKDQTVFAIQLGKPINRTDLHFFCKLVADGFLDKLSVMLENHTAKMRKAAEEVEEFIYARIDI